MDLVKSGEIILVDFDGVIAEANREDGTPYYPDFGPVRLGIKRFLYLCKQKGIVVEVWSARTNDSSDPDFAQCGDIAAKAIETYMETYDLPYTRINRSYKPLGSHHAKYLLDDRSFNFTSQHGYSRKFFGE